MNRRWMPMVAALVLLALACNAPFWTNRAANPGSGSPAAEGLPPATATAVALEPFLGQPPTPLLQSGEALQIGRLGSYCWKQPEQPGRDPSGESCYDAPAIPTPRQALPAGVPFTARLTLGLPLPPSALDLTVFPVTNADRAGEDAAQDTFFWPYREGQFQSLSLQPEQDLSLDLLPGRYVLTISATYAELGTSLFGFLLEVN